MSINNLVSFALILNDFNCGKLIPNKKSKIEFKGNMKGFKNVSYVRDANITFHNKRMTIRFNWGNNKHCLLITSFNFDKHVIHLTTKTVNGETHHIDISKMDEWNLNLSGNKDLLLDALYKDGIEFHQKLEHHCSSR